MKNLNLIVAVMAILLQNALTTFAGNYSWTGSTNTDWATSTNWNPNGTPTTNDTVTITNQTNNPVLAANTTIKNITMTTGTLSCNSYTLTVTGTGAFNGGTINSGTLTCYGTSTLTFAGTTFGVTVNATGNSLLLNGSRFNSTFTCVKKGTANDNGNGGNYFSGAVTITDSSSGNLIFSNSSSAPDTFNSTLTVAARSSGNIYLAHQGSGNLFNGNVTFSTGNIFSNSYGTAVYNGNITFNSTSGNITFGNNSGSCSIASGKTISIGTFSAGTLSMKNFTQNDSTVNITLSLTGTATLTLGSGNTFKANLKASSLTLKLEGTRFFGVDTFLYLGGSTTTNNGGNYFGKSVYFKNSSSSSTSSLYSGLASPDTFATTATFVTTNIGTIKLWQDLFLGQVYFKNETTPSTTTTIYSYGNVFKGNLSVESANGGIEFLKLPVSPYTNSILDSTGSFTVVSGYKGLLHLKEFEQRGSTAMNLQMTTNANANILKIGPGATFNANFTYYGNRFYLNGGTFNGNASFTKIGPNSSEICDGGNIFNGTTLICDSVVVSTTRFIQLATVNPDVYNGNVKFKQYATGAAATSMNLYPAYTMNSTFAGNVTVESNTIPIEFGANGGKIIFSGSGTQALTKVGTYVPSFKRIQINKPSGIVSLGYPYTLGDTLFLTKGVIATDTTNLLTVPDNGIVSGGSDSSYIHGPLKKIGNDVFTFALGDTSLHTSSYHPLSITAPDSVTNSYTARYYHQGQTYGNNKVDSLGYISNCEYWTLIRNTGSSQIKPTLGWNSNSCHIDTLVIRMVYFDGSKWISLGKSNVTGNNTKGTVQSISTVNNYGGFTLATICNTTANAGSNTNVCWGNTISLGGSPSASGGMSPYSYSWVPSSNLNSASNANPIATIYDAEEFILTVTDSNGCENADSVQISLDTNAYCLEGEIDSLERMMESVSYNYFDVISYGDSLFARHPAMSPPIDSSEDGLYAEYQRWVSFWSMRYSVGNNLGDRTAYASAIIHFPNTMQFTYGTVCQSGLANWQSIGVDSWPTQEIGKAQFVLPDYLDVTNNTVYLGCPGGGVFKTDNFLNGNPTWTSITDPMDLFGMWVNEMVEIDDGGGQPTLIVSSDQRYGCGAGILELDPINLTSITTPFTNVPLSYTFVKLLKNEFTQDVYALTKTSLWVRDYASSAWSITPLFTSVGDLRDMELIPNSAGAPTHIAVSGDGITNIYFINLSNGNYTTETNNLYSNTSLGWIQVEASIGNLYAIYSSSGDVFIDEYDPNTTTWSNYADPIDNTNLFGQRVEIQMHPDDPNVYYAEDPAAFNRWLLKSVDAGATTYQKQSEYNNFFNGTFTHCDIRKITLVPGNRPGINDVVYIANDGGVMVQNTPLNLNTDLFSWENKNGTGLNITQVHGLGATKYDLNEIVMGSQDNGNWLLTGGIWNKFTDTQVKADGSDGCFDVGNENKFITTNHNIIYYTADHGSTFSPQGYVYFGDALYPNTVADDNNNFYWPEMLAIQKFDGITSPVNIFNETIACNTSNNFNGIAVEGNIMYACLKYPAGACGYVEKLWKTTVGGGSSGSWTDLTGNFTGTQAFSANAGASRIAINSDDPDEVWITFTGWWDDGSGNGVNRVNRTTNGGTTWVDYSEGLPPFCANQIIYQKGSDGRVYLSTDVAVYYRDNTMTQWECFNDGLKGDLKMDLDINYCTQKLICGTFGRGVWETDLLPTNSILPASITWSTPQKLFTDLTIPAGLTLTITDDVAISAGRKITVQNTGRLEIIGGHLHANCNYMWEGIVVESGGEFEISGNGIIEDANYGVYSEKGTSLQFGDLTSGTGATLDRNCVGLYMAASGTGSATLNIFNTHFTCTSDLTNPYSSQTFTIDGISLTPLTHGFAGIYVEDGSINGIGGYNTVASTFSNLNIGIYAVNSNIGLRWPLFSDIQELDPYAIPSGILGTGIYSKSSTGAERLSFMGYGMGRIINSFENCKTGIHTDKVNTSVTATRFINNETGVIIENGALLSHGVVSSLIECSSTGISLSHNNGTLLTYISTNHINMNVPSGQTGKGVDVQEDGTINTRSTIFHNTIDFTSGSSSANVYGIEVNHAEGYVTDYNEIKLNNSATIFNGVRTTLSDNNTVSCNDVYGESGNPLTNADQRDYYISDCINYLIKCNTSNESTDGIYFDATNFGILEGNDIQDHLNGMNISSSGVIGVQTHEGNLWMNINYPSYGALDNNGSNLFIYDDTYFPILQTNVPDHFPLSLFLGDPVSDANCNGPYCNLNPKTKQHGGGGGSNSARIARDEIHSSVFDNVTSWTSKRSLMKELLMDTSLLSQDTAFASFYTDHLNDNIGLMSKFSIQLDTLNQIDSTTSSILLSSLSIIDRNLEIINYNDSLIENDSTLNSEDIGDLISENEIRNDSIEDATGDNRILYTDIFNDIATKAEQLANDYDTISTTEDYEADEILLNQVFLTTVAQGSWRDVSSFQSALASISAECPAERGPAVYHARSLYFMINDTIDYKDNCSKSCKPNRPIAISGPVKGQCGQSGVSYSVLPVPGATSYSWTTSDTSLASVSGLSNLTAVSIDFSNSFDSVQISVVASNSCGSLGPRVITVYGSPIKPPPISGNTSVCSYDVEYYSTTGSSGATSYNWTVPTDATILGSSTGPNILVYWGLNDGYITVSASNNCGNSEVDSIAVSINCRQANHSVIISDHIVAYPNPTKGLLNIELLNSTTVNHTLTIEDLMGNILINKNLNSGVTTQTFDLSNFAKGFYLMRVNSIEGTEVVKIAVH